MDSLFEYVYFLVENFPPYKNRESVLMLFFSYDAIIASLSFPFLGIIHPSLHELDSTFTLKEAKVVSRIIMERVEVYERADDVDGGSSRTSDPR